MTVFFASGAASIAPVAWAAGTMMTVRRALAAIADARLGQVCAAATLSRVSFAGAALCRQRLPGMPDERHEPGQQDRQPRQQ